MNKRIGKRIGLPSKNRPPVDRAALRAQYSITEGLPANPPYIYYWPGDGWHRALKSGYSRPISEKWALTYLGHLGNQKGKGYRKVLGMEPAVQEGK